MGKPYASELGQLSATLDWAADTDITRIREAVIAASTLPLIAVGSGGSLTAAHILAGAHRRYTGRTAGVVTPLEASSTRLDPSVSMWLLSAGGSNVDIINAFSALVAQEPRQLAVICGRRQSRLATLAAQHQFVDHIEAEGPAGRDGFLATNSLFAFAVLIARAYIDVYADEPLRIPDLHALISDAGERSGRLAEWCTKADKLWRRDTLVVLCGRSTYAASIDLESKFTEAALGHVQLADYRNFAHGRHHWLAKHGRTSAVLAFAADEDRSLATRTLALVPKTIPTLRIDVGGTFLESGLTSLAAALHLAGRAGRARGIDPGRPGVPEFGRRLFSLRIPKPRRPAVPGTIGPNDAAAIERKTGVPLSRLEKRSDLTRWHQALLTFRQHLADARYGAVVFDYDGTLVDTRDRYHPPHPDVATELRRLLNDGAIIGIATGRGASVRRDLKTCIPAPLWRNVIIGYYNGAEVTLLDDEDRPDNTPVPTPELQPVADALRSHPELCAIAQQTDRPWQITLTQKHSIPENRLWDIANQVVQAHAPIGASVVRSSHSIDILGPGISKEAVLAKIATTLPDHLQVLKIGDRGRWPGNDFVLLRQPDSLSADEVSVDPATCWNLAPPGYKGVQATLGYLRALHADGSGSFRLVLQT